MDAFNPHKSMLSSVCACCSSPIFLFVSMNRPVIDILYVLHFNRAKYCISLVILYIPACTFYCNSILTDCYSVDVTCLICGSLLEFKLTTFLWRIKTPFKFRWKHQICACIDSWIKWNNSASCLVWQWQCGFFTWHL